MKSKLFFLFLAIDAGLLAYGTYLGLVVAPTEATMGDVQRIFYCHVPGATTGFSLFTLNFVASVMFLWKRSTKADAWAISTAEVGVVFCTVVLVTGPIWARYAWGTWWVWDMRLTTTLILWLLYMSYLILRRSSEAGSTAVLAAALAIFAYIDVPIVYMANRWFRTNHPQPMIGTPALDPRMQKILFFNMFAFLIFGLLIAWFRYEMERTAQKISAAHIQRAARGTAFALLPAVALFQVPHKINPHVYLYSGYFAAWGVYAIYLVFLMTKLGRLKKEEAEMRVV
ncbi:MAG: cytochrome c biogenesis protein CcsA [Acidobacteriia bacterium]|nr:cytochrome c biogenesis protein CcsA [Terriglobia bacterium]